MADESLHEERYNHELLQDNGVKLFFGEVNVELCRDTIEFILAENIKKSMSHLTLLINSPGGDVDSGFALVDIINGSKIPVYTTGVGAIASMGLAIFITGKKGNRVLTPNTLIMSHQHTDCSFGKYHELVSCRKSQDIVQAMFVKHYRKHTNLNEKDVMKYLLSPSDTYITSLEAKKMGICDIVKEI